MHPLPLASLLAALLVISGSTASAQVRDPIPFTAAAQMPDALTPLSPGRVEIDGWLGERIKLNAARRLVEVDLEPLLAGYRKKPGSHPWIGEHIGKWMHAATLAWAQTDDPRLREKLEHAVGELIAAQESDGYLGTYVPDKRFGLFEGADWDVWSHKYCLIGLLTYHQYTGSPEALAASRRVADLLVDTFGVGRRSILSAGTHVGMAATSVLEPIVLLYRLTGEEKYLEFARTIVAAWDEPSGPRIVESLWKAGQVNLTANGKAYEMLSNLVGLCELARVTGEARYLTPALNAWEDVVRNHLYVTGTASIGELFRAPHDLPNGQQFNVGETCVTVTWIQLCLQLLRLTGDAKYADEIERSLYNHLCAAQRPDGRAWCYYTALEGVKPYGDATNCCLSSGPRGLALSPAAAYLTGDRDGEPCLFISTFEPSRARVHIAGREIEIAQSAGFPLDPQSTIRLSFEGEARFGIRLRVPQWALPVTIRENPDAVIDDAGWLVVPPRVWHRGDELHIRYALDARVVRGVFTNAGRNAMTWGPFVLAYDQSRNPDGPPANLTIPVKNAHPVLRQAGDGLSFNLPILAPARGVTEERSAVLVPFADAGRDGGVYRVWLWAGGTDHASKWSVLIDGRESRSALGNVSGSILDGDPATFVVTFDSHRRDEDFFSVALAEPRRIRRVVFTHGSTFHDGGWFDASSGPPRVECRRSMSSDWEPLGALASYPATTAADARGLKGGERFTFDLDRSIDVVALRVVGTPASGDSMTVSFASCAELEAFEK